MPLLCDAAAFFLDAAGMSDRPFAAFTDPLCAGHGNKGCSDGAQRVRAGRSWFDGLATNGSVSAALQRSVVDLGSCLQAMQDFPLEKEKGRCGCNGLLNLVPRRGLEPPRCYSLVPETSASTNSATWAFQERFELCSIKSWVFQNFRKYLFPETCCVGPAASHNHITRPLR